MRSSNLTDLIITGYGPGGEKKARTDLVFHRTHRDEQLALRLEELAHELAANAEQGNRLNRIMIGSRTTVSIGRLGQLLPELSDGRAQFDRGAGVMEL